MKRNAPEFETKKFKNPQKFLLKSGNFLRKYHFDELPNLINVILGNMSFIGYRPSLHSQVELNKKRKEKGIFDFKPGITGLAQVNGADKLTDELKLEFESSQSHLLTLHQG